MDIDAELAGIENSSATEMTAAPVAPAAGPQPQADPVPGSVVELEVTNFTQPQPLPQPAPPAEPAPVAQPQPAPTEPTAPQAAAPTPAQPTNPPAAPAPTEPQVVIPSDTPRRVYTHAGMSDDNKLLLGLINANPGLKLEAVVAAASAELGRPLNVPGVQQPAAPTAPAQQQPTQEPAKLTLGAAESRLDQIAAELESLDPVINAEDWKRLTLEQGNLSRKLPHLIATQQQQQQTAAQTNDALIDQVRAEVAQSYPSIQPAIFDAAFDTSNPLSSIQDPLALAVATRVRQDMATDSPMLDAPDYELLVTAACAQSLGILPQNRQAQPPAAPQQPAAPAAPQPGQQAPAAGHQPLSVMPAVPGSQHTSADRVTIQPAAPQADLEAQYQQAVAAGDFAAMEAVTAKMAAGPQANQPPLPGQIVAISYSGRAA